MSNRELRDIYLGGLVSENKQPDLKNAYRQVYEHVDDNNIPLSYKHDADGIEVEGDSIYGDDKWTGPEATKEKLKLVNEWMEQNGFQHDNTVKSLLFNLDHAGVDWERLKSFIGDDKSMVGASFLGLVGGGGVNPVSLRADLIDVIQQFLPDGEKATRLFFDLFSTNFSESTVSVGKGELCVALLTDAVKGSVGDLELLGVQAEEEEEADDDGEIKDGVQQVYGLAVGGSGQAGSQIELKVGKARVVSARKGQFKATNLAIEKAYGMMMPRDENGLALPEAKPVAKAWNQGKTAKMWGTGNAGGFGDVVPGQDKAEYIGGGGTAFYNRSWNQDTEDVDGQPANVYTPLNDLEFIDYLVENVSLDGLTTFDRKEAKIFLMRALGVEDGDTAPQTSLRGPREDAISALIVWSYANPVAEGSHGFDWLVCILAAGLNPTKLGVGTKMDFNKYKDYTLGGDGETGTRALGWGHVNTFDQGIAVQTQGDAGYDNILEAITGGSLVVERMNRLTGTIDGEGIYMYYAGSNTNVKYETQVGGDHFERGTTGAGFLGTQQPIQ